VKASNLASPIAATLLSAVVLLGTPPAMVHAETIVAPTVHYHTVKVDGVDIFYREAGPATAPTVLLLHGFPTS
jgi:hypothetical protein